jgi:hypothetical protein
MVLLKIVPPTWHGMRYRPNIHVDGVSQCGEMNEYASENGKIVGDSEDISWLSGGANLTTHFSD